MKKLLWIIVFSVNKLFYPRSKIKNNFVISMKKEPYILFVIKIIEFKLMN